MGRPRSRPELPKRKRGGQPGNRNRLKHGFYTRAERAMRVEARSLTAQVAHLAATGGLRQLEPVITPKSKGKAEGKG